MEVCAVKEVRGYACSKAPAVRGESRRAAAASPGGGMGVAPPPGGGEGEGRERSGRHGAKSRTEAGW